MDDNWEIFTEIDFSDESIKAYHIDTRDFHVSASTKESEKKPDCASLKKYPDRFFHTPEEVVKLLTRYYEEAGGKAEWRFFMLRANEPKLDNWSMKYIRIYRFKEGLVVCNNNQYALRKSLLDSPVNNDPEILGVH